jgi:RNA polymerase subunit RPABC4/transcription elongation factor Spt4
LIRFFIKSITAISLNKNRLITVLLWPNPIFPNFTIRFHTLRVKISSFCHIADINFNWSNLTVIFDFEIKPISMSFGIGITSQKAIILIFFNFNNKIKITTFKWWIKFMITMYNLNFWCLFITYFSNSVLDNCQIKTITLSISPKIRVFLINLNRVDITWSNIYHRVVRVIFSKISN